MLTSEHLFSFAAVIHGDDVEEFNQGRATDRSIKMFSSNPLQPPFPLEWLQEIFKGVNSIQVYSPLLLSLSTF